MRDRIAAVLLFAAAFCGDRPSTALILLIAGVAVQTMSGYRLRKKVRSHEIRCINAGRKAA